MKLSLNSRKRQAYTSLMGDYIGKSNVGLYIFTPIMTIPSPLTNGWFVWMNGFMAYQPILGYTMPEKVQ